MNTQELAIFSENLLTEDDLLDRLEELNSWLLGSNGSDNISIYEKMYQLALKNGVSAQEIDKFKQANTLSEKDLLKQVVLYLKSVEVVNLTLAFVPEETFLKTLSNALSQASGRKVVLSIKRDRSIVAGLKIEFQGKYKDYSVAPKIEAFLKQKIAKNSLEVAQ